MATRTRKPARRRNVPTSPEEGIREGLADIAAGRVRGPFKNAKELIADLRRHAKRARRARAR